MSVTSGFDPEQTCGAQMAPNYRRAAKLQTIIDGSFEEDEKNCSALEAVYCLRSLVG